MKFDEAMEWMEECNQLGSVLGLENMENLMDALGHPDEKCEIIHVAGTNGKGSVSSYIAEIAQMNGKKVGRYISPTIFCYQERFQINKKQIGKEKLATYLSELKELCDHLVDQGKAHPTAFEIETALALLYFARENCDLVVLEVGMGGRLDATNIILHPLICVLTSISFDHMQFLGDSLESITREKCGIIKKGCSVVSASQNLEVKKLILKQCENLKVELTFVDEKQIRKVKSNLKKQCFSYKNKTYNTSLLGAYQIENACLAIECMEVYEKIQKVKNSKFALRKVEEAISKTEWPGRFQIIQQHPYFVVDGAHNVDGAKMLMKSIDNYFTNTGIIYIMGMFRDKEYEKVVRLTCGRAKQIITVATPNNPRALSAMDLALEVQKVNPNVTTAGSIEEAVEMAYLFAEKEDVIISFGSLSFLGRMMDIVTKNKTVRSDTHGQ